MESHGIDMEKTWKRHGNSIPKIRGHPASVHTYVHPSRKLATTMGNEITMNATQCDINWAKRAQGKGEQFPLFYHALRAGLTSFFLHWLLVFC